MDNNDNINEFAKTIGYLSKETLSPTEIKEIKLFLSLFGNTVKQTTEKSDEREMLSILFDSIMETIVKNNHIVLIDSVINVGEQLSSKKTIANIALYHSCHSLEINCVKYILDNHPIEPNFIYRQSTFTDITVGMNMNIMNPTPKQLQTTLDILDLLHNNGVNLDKVQTNNSQNSQLFNALMYGKYGIRNLVAEHLSNKYDLDFLDKEHPRILMGRPMEVAFLLNKKPELIQTVKRNDSIQVKKSQFHKKTYEELLNLGQIDQWNALLEKNFLNTQINAPTSIRKIKKF